MALLISEQRHQLSKFSLQGLKNYKFQEIVNNEEEIIKPFPQNWKGFNIKRCKQKPLQKRGATEEPNEQNNFKNYKYEKNWNLFVDYDNINNVL